MEKAALIPLQPGEPVIIINSENFCLGRSLSNNYVIREMSVSRIHCSLIYKNDRWVLVNKSVNKTFVNDEEVSGNVERPLVTNDIIKLTYAASYKFVHPYDENTSMVSTGLKRKFETEETNDKNKCDQKRKTLHQSHNSQEASTSAPTETQLLQDEVNLLRHLRNQCKEENKNLKNRLMEMEADAMDKLLNTIGLEREIDELKANYASLEREKEELQLQLTDYECQTTLLKLRLDNLTKLEENQTTSPAKTETKIKENPDDGSDSDLTEDEADNDIVQSVIKAEISDKELTMKEKLAETINLLKTIKPVKPKKSNKPDILQTITTNLLELQTGVEELAAKRSELESNSSNKPQNQCNNTVANTESFTQSKEEFIQVIQNQEDAISDMKEAFKAEFLLKFWNSLELDLQCSICHELFVNATCLDCGHIFCKKCIVTWRQMRKSCPTCRKPIKTLLGCVSLNSYIDQCYELLFPDKKELRNKIKQSHQDVEDASTSGAATSTSRAEPIVLSSEDEDDDENFDVHDEEYISELLDGENSDMTDFDSDYDEDDFFGRRPPYGSCFICGDPDHWANACPMRRGRRS